MNNLHSLWSIEVYSIRALYAWDKMTLTKDSDISSVKVYDRTLNFQVLTTSFNNFCQKKWKKTLLILTFLYPIIDISNKSVFLKSCFSLVKGYSPKFWLLSLRHICFWHMSSNKFQNTKQRTQWILSLLL